MPAAGQRDAFLPLLSGLIALAWVTLWVWASSPYGRYLDHGRWDAAGLAASICRALPAGDIIVPAVLYVGGCTLMSAAMMLPTTFPLIAIFRRFSAERSDRNILTMLLLAGYLGAWGAFGVAAHLLDWGIHAVFARFPLLGFHAWAVGAGVVALAGLFQFSTIKYRCLDKCRTPLSFVLQYWRGTAYRRQAFFLGVHHGVFCVGCCWALMFLMFVVGMGSLVWMLALGAVMAVEKNISWGRKLSAPLGWALLAWAALIAVEGVGI